MNSRLQNLFNQLESDRIRIMQILDTLPKEKFELAPSSKWSIHQILSHLMIAEKLTLLYMRKKILGIKDVDESGMVESVKMLLLKISQRLPFKFKAPKFVIEHTPVYKSQQHLLESWLNERMELKEFLEKFGEHELKKKIYKHPRAGMMNIQHALRFAHEHFLHHLPQIKRLI